MVYYGILTKKNTKLMPDTILLTFGQSNKSLILDVKQ